MTMLMTEPRLVTDEGAERRRGLRIRQNRPIKVLEPATSRYFGGQTEDADLIRRYRDLDVNRVSVSLPSEKADTILPVLDRWAAIIRAVNG